MESSYWLRSQKTASQQGLSSTSKKKKTKKSTAGGSLDKNPFNSLPTEILLKILGYLPVYDRVHVERVCKRWKNVSIELVQRDIHVLNIVRQELQTEYYRFKESLEKFGKFITTDNNEFFIGPDELEILKSLLSKAGQHVKKLVFHFDPDDFPTKSVLSIIADHCHNIESIEFFRFEKSAVRVFLKLLRVNKQLRSITCADADNFIEKLPLRDWKALSLESGEEMEEKDWTNRLTILIENSPSLEELFLSYFSSKGMEAILKCEKLKNVNFPHWFGGELRDQVMNPSFLNHVTCFMLAVVRHEIDSLIDFLPHCINLESLTFYPYYFGPLPLGIVLALLALPKLESLKLYANSLNDDIVIRLLKFKRLEFYCTHSSSHNITGNGIFEMIMNSECLEKLKIPSGIPSTTELFKRLVKNTGGRRKTLEIEVPVKIYEVALNICKGSKIRIIEKKLQLSI